MALYGPIWVPRRPYGPVWPCSQGGTQEAIWPCSQGGTRRPYGPVWPYMAVTWPYTVQVGSIWPYMAIYRVLDGHMARIWPLHGHIRVPVVPRRPYGPGGLGTLYTGS